MPEKRVILVIEDDHAISNFICRALTANDYKAIPAASGKEGLSLFFSHSPDLVLLDLGLPDMDGLEVLEQFIALAHELDFHILGLTFSPVKGPEGNIEFLGHLTLSDQPENCPDPAEVVRQAHETLDKGADV